MSDTLYSLVVYVPVTHADSIRACLERTHAGALGNYSGCSFSVKGTGRFRPRKGARPTIGEVGKREEVEEERIEVLIEEKHLKCVLSELKTVHPYEEPAIHFFRIQTSEGILKVY